MRIFAESYGSSGCSDDELHFENETFNGFFAANVGGRVLSTEKFKLDLETLFKHFDNGLNYFGGQVSVRYAF